MVLRKHVFTLTNSLEMCCAYADMVAIVLRDIPGQTLKGTKRCSATTGQEAIAAMALNAVLLMARGN